MDLRCVRRGTNYLHLCDQWTWHNKRFSTNWRRICSSSNCSGTSATLTTAAVADTVTVAPNIKKPNYFLTYLLFVVSAGCDSAWTYSRERSSTELHRWWESLHILWAEGFVPSVSRSCSDGKLHNTAVTGRSHSRRSVDTWEFTETCCGNITSLANKVVSYRKTTLHYMKIFNLA